MDATYCANHALAAQHSINDAKAKRDDWLKQWAAAVVAGKLSQGDIVSYTRGRMTTAQIVSFDGQLYNNNTGDLHLIIRLTSIKADGTLSNITTDVPYLPNGLPLRIVHVVLQTAPTPSGDAEAAP